MSRVIKAADLKVLIPNDSQTVIPTLQDAQEESNIETARLKGTVLDSANLLDNAKQKASEILEQAQNEANELVARTTEEVETLRLQAKERGFEQGYEEGLSSGHDAGLEQARDLLELLEATVEEAVQVRARSLQALEEDFLKFSLLLADNIVRKNVTSDISWLNPIIKDAVASLGQVQYIQVRLNPNDYSLVKEEEEKLQLGIRTKLQFENDPTISQGGCLIESENGLIDARLEKRLEKTFKRLMDVLYDENY